MPIGFSKMEATHCAARNPAWWVRKHRGTNRKGEYFAKLYRDGKQDGGVRPRAGRFLKWEAVNEADLMIQQSRSNPRRGKATPGAKLVGCVHRSC